MERWDSDPSWCCLLCSGCGVALPWPRLCPDTHSVWTQSSSRRCTGQRTPERTHPTHQHKLMGWFLTFTWILFSKQVLRKSKSVLKSTLGECITWMFLHIRLVGLDFWDELRWSESSESAEAVVCWFWHSLWSAFKSIWSCVWSDHWDTCIPEGPTTSKAPITPEIKWTTLVKLSSPMLQDPSMRNTRSALAPLQTVAQ